MFLRLWPPVPSQDGASQTVKTVMQGIVKSSLTLQESPDQSQAQSDTREVEHPQIEDIFSEGELSDSDCDQEDHSGKLQPTSLNLRPLSPSEGYTRAFRISS